MTPPTSLALPAVRHLVASEVRIADAIGVLDVIEMDGLALDHVDPVLAEVSAARDHLTRALSRVRAVLQAAGAIPTR